VEQLPPLGPVPVRPCHRASGSWRMSQRPG
jgi:hypothetical protein